MYASFIFFIYDMINAICKLMQFVENKLFKNVLMLFKICSNLYLIFYTIHLYIITQK